MNPIDNETANRRAYKKTELVRHRHKALSFTFRTTRHRPERQCAAGRLNHRATDTLHEAKQDQLQNILRKAAERTVDDLWTAIGRLVDVFTPSECANYFSAAGYDAD